jgi:predicted Fe-Mo cluster-binding NifX family protein
MKKPTCLAILIVLQVFTGLVIKAQPLRADTRQSLRGLNGVYIVAQIVDEQPEGITTNRIETLAKSALADAGISVQAEPQRMNGDANLSITIDTIKQPQLDVYAFTVEVAVTQDVRLSRMPHADWISAETWRKSLQGINSPDRTDFIEQALKQCLKYFTTDYSSVNPK